MTCQLIESVIFCMIAVVELFHSAGSSVLCVCVCVCLCEYSLYVPLNKNLPLAKLPQWWYITTAHSTFWCTKVMMMHVLTCLYLYIEYALNWMNNDLQWLVLACSCVACWWWFMMWYLFSIYYTDAEKRFFYILILSVCLSLSFCGIIVDPIYQLCATLLLVGYCYCCRCIEHTSLLWL